MVLVLKGKFGMGIIYILRIRLRRNPIMCNLKINYKTNRNDTFSWMFIRMLSVHCGEDQWGHHLNAYSKSDPKLNLFKLWQAPSIRLAWVKIKYKDSGPNFQIRVPNLRLLNPD